MGRKRERESERKRRRKGREKATNWSGGSLLHSHTTCVCMMHHAACQRSRAKIQNASRQAHKSVPLLMPDASNCQQAGVYSNNNTAHAHGKHVHGHSGAVAPVCGCG